MDNSVALSLQQKNRENRKYKIMKQTTKQNFPVLEMGCTACAARVAKILGGLQGVTEANVNFASGMASVEYDAKVISPQQMQEAVRQGGYDLVIVDNEEKKAEEAEVAQADRYKALKKQTVGAICFTLPLIVLGMCFTEHMMAKYLMWILSTPVVFWFGRDFHIHSWKQLKHRSANMDTLVSNSTLIAYVFSLFNLFFPQFWIERGIEPHVYFEASAGVIAFVLVGRLLEERAKGNTSSAIKKLMGLQPKTVTLQTADGRTEQVEISKIKIGDTLIIKPGEKVAVDGRVIDGASYVDESMLSGEPIPIYKEAKAEVFAGTVNQKGSFRYRAEKVGTNTMLAQIIRLVQEAQGSKAPVQKLADRIASVFVPTILCISLITFALWCIFDTTNGFTHGIMAATTVLVIACPCALGLATPTAIMVGIGKGAENGILIKDAESLETARRIDAVVLDKTGTITEGKPVVTDIAWNGDSASKQDILFSIEKRSEHPLAESIAQRINGNNIVIEDFESLTGMGVSAKYEGVTYYVGNLRLMTEQGVSVSDYLQKTADRLNTEAKTVIWFADEKEALAVIAVTDPIKPTSAEAIKKLQAEGIEVYMLTGDNTQTASTIAKTIGIKKYQAEVLPAQKADFVKRLQAEGKTVAMIGDGINDSAALAQSDLSIAMGKGSDIAMNVAKMTIISSDLRKTADAIQLSKATVLTIKQNLFWAFIYNVISIPVAAGALYPLCGLLLNPMIAGAAMAISSISVVLNSLRLKRKRVSK